jgi:hypothetical protein
VPADDFTDPAVTTISSHMDCVIVLSRAQAAEGLLSRDRPAGLVLDAARPAGGGRDALQTAEAVRQALIAVPRTDRHHLAARGRGTRRRRPADRQARPAAAAFPDPALHGDRGLYRPGAPASRSRTRSLAAGDSGRRDRRLVGKLALHGRHAGGCAETTEAGGGDMRLRIVTPLSVVVDERSIPCAPRMPAAVSASCPATPRF